MKTIGKYAAAVTLAGLLAATAITPSEARNGRWAAAGVGFAAGALLGAAVANNYYYGPGYYAPGYYGPAYYGPGPYAYEPVYVAPRYRYYGQRYYGYGVQNRSWTETPAN